ncbi:uncharacterized protein LOC142240882 [Haematobia irritans]|uniref:uncharacterized protein LOC142240882 n=1 Tax=Haematobia irritans TaxID=7368 RepID=UPI003F506290
MKLLIFFGLLAVAAAVSVSKTRDIILGNVGPKDVLVYRQKISMAKRDGEIQRRIIRFFPWYATAPITGVIVKNMVLKKEVNQTPKVEILRGGLGTESIKLRLSSQKSQGMHVEVRIYAKY